MDPPLFVGAFQTIVALALPGEAVTFVGALGTVDGMTALDGYDGRPVPDELMGETVNV